MENQQQQTHFGFRTVDATAKQGMVGGNDWTSFRFKTISAPVDLQGVAGQTLVLSYARPWEFEAGRPAEQIWQMQIVVKPGS